MQRRMRLPISLKRQLPHVRIGVGRGMIRIRQPELDRFISSNLKGRLRNAADPPRHVLKKLVG